MGQSCIIINNSIQSMEIKGNVNVNAVYEVNKSEVDKFKPKANDLRQVNLPIHLITNNRDEQKCQGEVHLFEVQTACLC